MTDNFWWLIPFGIALCLIAAGAYAAMCEDGE